MTARRRRSKKMRKFTEFITAGNLPLLVAFVEVTSERNALLFDLFGKVSGRKLDFSKDNCWEVF